MAERSDVPAAAVPDPGRPVPVAASRRPLPLPDGWPAVSWCTTTRADGDFAIDGPPGPLAARRRAVLDRPWVWLRQVHGAVVHTVGSVADVGAVAGRDGDGLVTASSEVALAVQTADCGPVVLASPEGVIGVAHAGWRGIVAGVIGATAAAMRSAGATELVAAVGPCIHAECYEFTGPERDALALRFGPAVAGRTATGTPALDVPAALRAALAEIGMPTPDESMGVCTACDAGRWFSHRARGETGRMATVVWREVP